MDIDWPLAIMAAAWAIILGGGGGVLTEIGDWYHNLKKPSWQPPDWLFGPAWAVILGLSAWSFYLASKQAETTNDALIIGGLFAVNFILHFAWSPLFFKAKRPDWALAENWLLWLSVLFLTIGLRDYSELAAWLNLPYLVWVSFALFLNWKIVQLNGPFDSPSRKA